MLKTLKHPDDSVPFALAGTGGSRFRGLAQSVVRIGMTAADIPRTLGQPDQGFEGNRFTGNTMYEGLTLWDLSSADKASVVIPGLATEWAVVADDKTKWIFKLRPGVKFHDGSDFTADAVVWNVEKVLKQDAPHFDAEPGRRHRLAHAEPAQRAQDRRPDGRIDDRGARCAAADQSDQPVHGVARALEEALRRGERDRSRRKRPSRRGMRSRAMPPAPARGRWTSSFRANGSNS